MRIVDQRKCQRIITNIADLARSPLLLLMLLLMNSTSSFTSLYGSGPGGAGDSRSISAAEVSMRSAGRRSGARRSGTGTALHDEHGLHSASPTTAASDLVQRDRRRAILVPRIVLGTFRVAGRRSRRSRAGRGAVAARLRRRSTAPAYAPSARPWARREDTLACL